MASWLQVLRSDLQLGASGSGMDSTVTCLASLMASVVHKQRNAKSFSFHPK